VSLFRSPHPNRDDVAIVLATGLCVGVILITSAVMWDSITNGRIGLSENSTQVLTAALTGMIGLLGGYIGGQRRPGDPSGDHLSGGGDPPETPAEDEDPPTP
jgi:hypothetical protein